jgi:hypothetical protein
MATLSPSTARLLADAILALHVGVAMFVIFGQIAILIGAWRSLVVAADLLRGAVVDVRRGLPAFAGLIVASWLLIPPKTGAEDRDTHFSIPPPPNRKPTTLQPKTGTT